MSSMPCAASSNATGVEADALPTKHTAWSGAYLEPFHCTTATRGGRRWPCPTASKAFISSLSWVVVEDLDLTPKRDSSSTRSANSTGPRTLAGSLTRSRAKKCRSRPPCAGKSRFGGLRILV